MIGFVLAILSVVLAFANVPFLLAGSTVNLVAFGFCCAAAGFNFAVGLRERL